MPSILNNSGTRMSLGQLNKNITKVGQALSKISSGQRINSASVDAASFSIGARMLQQLRALDQDAQNTQNGNSMFKVASGGIEEIVENIKRLKELAIDAANDSNTDLDRATIQKEFDQRKLVIDDIVYSSEYNGKILLDGTYGRMKSTSTSFFSGKLGIPDTKTEPTGTPVTITNSMISGGTINISDEDAVFKLAEDLDPCTINVTSSNVKIIGANSEKDVSIVMKNPASLWVENLKLSTSNDQTFIDFQGQDSYLHLSGTSTFKQIGSTNGSNLNEAAVHVGGNVNIEGSGTLTINQGSSRAGAAIGTDGYDYGNQANIAFLSGSVNISHDCRDGCAIGAGYYGGKVGAIINDGSDINIAIKSYDPAIGAAIGSDCKYIFLNGGSTKAVSNYSGNYEVVGIYSSNASVGGVNFNGGLIYLEAQAGGVAVSPDWPGVPESGFLDEEKKIYSIDLPSISSSDESGGSSFAANGNLRIHHGPKSNNFTQFFINDMRVEALGLNDVEVTTRPKAERAIDVIDRALEYALDVATDVGAYIERLEFTQSNIEENAENTQAAESTIMDADMAKEMTEYTKSNILSQASQSMLAQANQNMAGVLSLLQ